MEPSTSGSIRLFRAAGIDVYLHWSWFAVAWLQISLSRDPKNEYTWAGWKVIEYLTLFGIVLLHEFGHALACRQVGGLAERIVLWPLGGIAYVQPPPRPGAVLWSIAAGPLVNLALVPVTLGLLFAGRAWGGWETAHPDLDVFLRMVCLMNASLLVFNLLPVYPLDGGQVLQALLWYVLGRWQSLQVVSIVGGLLGGLFFFAGLLLVAVSPPDAWVGGLMVCFMAAFVALRSFHALQASRYMLQLERLPRHRDCACPSCDTCPPRGTFWACEHCETRFDTFRTRGKCPACGAWYLETGCPHCRARHHIDEWFARRPPEEVRDPIVLGPTPEQSAPS
jgi:Zn-dependent protease